MNRIAVQTKVQATGPFIGDGVNVSTVTENAWTLVIEIINMTPSTTARFTFEDSADGFVSDILPGPPVSVEGQIGDGSGNAAGFSPNTLRYSFTEYDFPDLRIGVSACALRLNLTRLSGNNGRPSIVYQSWIEY